jgi:hypothetical protein
MHEGHSLQRHSKRNIGTRAQAAHHPRNALSNVQQINLVPEARLSEIPDTLRRTRSINPKKYSLLQRQKPQIMALLIQPKG